MALQIFDRDVHAVVGPPLSQVMGQFGCDAFNCDLNVFVMPLALLLTDQVLPSLDLQANNWVPWDYCLRPDQHVRLVVMDLQLFDAFRFFSPMSTCTDLRLPRLQRRLAQLSHLVGVVCNFAKLAIGLHTLDRCHFNV